MEKTYDQSVDIWGVGCILAELMGKAETSMAQDNENSVNKLVLFKGKSCFPMSPAVGTDKNIVTNDD